MAIRVAVWGALVLDGAILLIEFDDPRDGGWHFNLPGGGVDDGETLHEAMVREMREETGAQVEVGELLFVYDYVPSDIRSEVGRVHTVRPVFRCTLKSGSTPHMPNSPDDYQIGVRWVPLTELSSIPLLPPMSSVLLAALQTINPRDPYLCDLR